MPAETDILPRLFVHARRPDWGLAVIAEDRAIRRSYLFQDGRLRTFSKRFLHFFQRAETPTDVTRQIARRLGRQVPDRVEKPVVRRAAKATFEEQLQVFMEVFPDGFEDSAYVRQFRTGPRPRKSHAQVALQTARRLLSKRRMRAHVEDEIPVAIHRDAMQLMDAVSLCTTRNKNILKKLSPQRRLVFAEGLHALLHDDAPFLHRFTRFLTAVERLEKQPSWTAMTLFSGLMEPDEHVIVHARSFELQARAIEPALVFNKTPSSGLYPRLQALAGEVRDRLQAAGLTPRDFIDVHHFMRQTLRPKALSHMKAARAA